MITYLSGLFTSLGWSRDDLKWFYAQLVAGAGLVFTGAANLTAVGDYLGVHLSTTQEHWIVAVCVVILWIGGKMSTSQLFAAGHVPK